MIELDQISQTDLCMLSFKSYLQETKSKVNEELKRYFKPEFLNRIDETIVFHELTLDEVKEIVDLMLDRVHKQLKN